MQCAVCLFWRKWLVSHSPQICVEITPPPPTEGIVTRIVCWGDPHVQTFAVPPASVCFPPAVRHNNVLAYVGNCYHPPYNGEYKGFNDAFHSNTCLFRHSDCPTGCGYNSDCGVVAGFEVSNNTVYSQTGALRVCGKDFAQYQADGHDPGTTVKSWPDDAALIALGKAVLGV